MRNPEEDQISSQDQHVTRSETLHISATVLTSGRTRSCWASETRFPGYAGQVPASLRAQYLRRGSPERAVAVWMISSAGWSTVREAITMGEP